MAEETEETGDLVRFSGKSYYYEDGEMAASKEAFVDGAWRWFDEDGTMVVSKEAYLRSYAGPYADNEDGTGKWVRYDQNGAMAKGHVVIDGKEYYFDEITGIMKN